MSENRGKGGIPDDFWDIESLIPEKKNKPYTETKRPAYDVSSVEIEHHPKGGSSDNVFKGSSFTRFVPPHTEREREEQPKPELEYKPTGSLIHSVKVYSIGSKYSFYERFLDDAMAYRDAKGEKCPPVPFFSYTPQYSQMNRAQLAYYLWWRENVRAGVYPDADYSYVLLYLYELINLSPVTDKEYTLDMLCNIWLNYGRVHHFVSRYLGEWVCDFCLINQMPVPTEKLRPLYSVIMKNCLIKEFYVSGGDGKDGIGRICADTLIEVASAYDYRKSRYATEERLPSMKRHMVGALDAVLREDDGAESCILDGMKPFFADNTATRTAYTGALCTAAVRKKIEIEYYSFSRSYELRYLVADIMKYTENRLRRIWGIKSRLSIYALPTPVRKRVDEYFDTVAPDMKRDQQRVADDGTKEYEKLYDVPRAPLSLELADKIEESSWETTKILVETFDEAEPATEETAVSVPDETETTQNEGGDFPDTLGKRFGLLLAILSENVTEQRRVASSLSAPVEALVDEINELAADMLGDVLIEEGEVGYVIIEDYRELVESMRDGKQ